MRRDFIAAGVSAGLLIGPAVPDLAAATQYHSYRHHSYLIGDTFGTNAMSIPQGV